MPEYLILLMCAFLLYTACFIMTWFQKRFSVGSIFTIALILDCIATYQMLAMSERSGISLHGAVGILALVAFLVLWGSLIFHDNGSRDTFFTRNGIRIYRVLYFAWVLSFIAGALTYCR